MLTYKEDGSYSVETYYATNKVKTPEERNNVPVQYGGYRYYPEQFPSGTWNVTGKSEKSDNPNLGPTKIRTDATKEVSTYEYDDDFREYVENGKVQDSGYLIHTGATPDATTWGCIRISEEDIGSLSKQTDAALDSGGTVKITVR